MTKVIGKIKIEGTKELLNLYSLTNEERSKGVCFKLDSGCYIQVSKITLARVENPKEVIYLTKVILGPGERGYDLFNDLPVLCTVNHKYYNYYVARVNKIERRQDLLSIFNSLCPSTNEKTLSNRTKVFMEKFDIPELKELIFKVKFPTIK